MSLHVLHYTRPSIGEVCLLGLSIHINQVFDHTAHHQSCCITPDHYAAIVTSTSTPASMLMMICLTTSVGAFKLSKRRKVSDYRAQKRIVVLCHEPEKGFLHKSRDSLNQSLVDPHLVSIPCLTALSAGCFASCNFKGLGRKADRPFYSKIL